MTLACAACRCACLCGLPLCLPLCLPAVSCPCGLAVVLAEPHVGEILFVAHPTCDRGNTCGSESWPQNTSSVKTSSWLPEIGMRVASNQACQNVVISDSGSYQGVTIQRLVAVRGSVRTAGYGRGEGADLGAPRRPRRRWSTGARACACAPVRRHRAVGRGAGVVDRAGARPRRFFAPSSQAHGSWPSTGEPAKGRDSGGDGGGDGGGWCPCGRCGGR